MLNIIDKFFMEFKIPETEITDTMYFALLNILLERCCNYTFYKRGWFTPREQILKGLISEKKKLYDKVRKVFNIEKKGILGWLNLK